MAVDEDGLIVLLSARSEQLFDFAREELVGRSVEVVERSVEVLVPSHARSSHVLHRLGYVADPQPRRSEESHGPERAFSDMLRGYTARRGGSSVLMKSQIPSRSDVR